MKCIKGSVLVLVFFLLSFQTVHKYYISLTQIDYAKETQSLQITSRLFIDDFEKILKSNFDKSIVLEEKEASKLVDVYITKYLKDNLQISINNDAVDFNFIGKEYIGDILKCYLEVENVTQINTFSISNRVLFDLYSDQQNIIKTKINKNQKSVIHTKGNDKTLLKFN